MTTSPTEENLRVLQASIDHLYLKLTQTYSNLITIDESDSEARSKAKREIAEEWQDSYQDAKLRQRER